MHGYLFERSIASWHQVSRIVTAVLTVKVSLSIASLPLSMVSFKCATSHNQSWSDCGALFTDVSLLALNVHERTKFLPCLQYEDQSTVASGLRALNQWESASGLNHQGLKKLERPFAEVTAINDLIQ